jgi:hypothetical protein
MYTRVWDNTAPNGTVVDAADLDRVCQELRVDIAERMATILGNNTFVTTDPLYYTNLTFGVASGKIISGITAILFRDSTDTNTNLTVNSDGTVSTRSTLTVLAGGAVLNGEVIAHNQTRNDPHVIGSVAVNTPIDFDNGNVQTITLAASVTLTLTNGKAGAVYVLKVKQDATGGRVATFAAASGTLKWPSAAAIANTTTANKEDVYTFFCDGTDYYGGRFGANY